MPSNGNGVSSLLVGHEHRMFGGMLLVPRFLLHSNRAAAPGLSRAMALDPALSR